MNDNDSQSDEELIKELNQPEEEKNVPLADKFAQNNPFFKMGSATYQNVQTQSIVKSSREEAGEQLAAIDAQNAALARQQQFAAGVNKAKHTGVYIMVGILFAAILGAAIWLAVVAINAGRKTIAPAEESGPEETVTYDEIDGYKCITKTCSKVTSIDANRFIVHDGTQFYIYDMSAKKKTNTTIPEREYHSITTFKWGDKLYAILDPESAKSALYSISSNLVLTEFSYDDFIKDINNAVYNDMKWVEGRYIIAKSGTGFRLVDVTSGKEIVRGAKRVFIRESYAFGYESDGTTRAYSTDGKNIAVINSTDNAFIRNNTLIVVTVSDDYYTLYDTTGEQVNEGAVYDEISTKIYENVAATLKKDNRYFMIPLNN
ncbi:hypothetical protein J6X09_00170 [Candidatus Saccharibacteria bacterium]|nr:hypothetical protein [Candidatus Saccharibacteria bacterium]